MSLVDLEGPCVLIHIRAGYEPRLRVAQDAMTTHRSAQPCSWRNPEVAPWFFQRRYRCEACLDPDESDSSEVPGLQLQSGQGSS